MLIDKSEIGGSGRNEPRLNRVSPYRMLEA
jgi:hypothetical protein